MSTEIEKRLIGVEDIDFDTDGDSASTNYEDVNGNIYPVHKINDSHIPLCEQTREVFEDGDTLTVGEAIRQLKTDIEDGVGNNEVLSQNSTLYISDPSQMQAQVNGIPKDLGGHTQTLEFSGEELTFYNALLLSGFKNGKIVLNGNESVLHDGADIGECVELIDCDCTIEIKDLTFEHDSSDYGVKATRCPWLYFTNCGFSGNESDETSTGICYTLSHGIETACTFEGDIPRVVFDATAASGGRNLFDIFFSASTDVPSGAIDLSLGFLIENCNTRYPEFWSECVKRKTDGTIRCLTESAWQSELTSNGGSCGAFVVDETTHSVRLPKITDYLRSSVNADNGVYQTNQNKKHTHTGSTVTTTIRSGTWHNVSVAGEMGVVGNNGEGTSSYSGDFTIASDGGTEARPNTVCMKLYIQVELVNFAAGGDNTQYLLGLITALTARVVDLEKYKASLASVEALDSRVTALENA